MTQTSYYHNGATKGDATNAPYSAALFTSILNTTYQTDGAYVLPTSLDTQYHTNLQAEGQAARRVDVYAGYAFIAGTQFYNSSSAQVALTANTSPYPRIDRIVARIDWQTKTGSLVAVEGIPAEVPVPPTLQQIPGVIYEMSLARVYLPSGYTTTTNTVADERQFACTTAHENYYRTQNILPNSEMMAVNWDNRPPVYWTAVNAPAFSGYLMPKFDQMPRGRTVKITATTTGQGMTTPIRTRNAGGGSWEAVCTMRMLVKVVSGSWGIGMYDGSADMGYTVIYPSQEPQEVIIRFRSTSTVPSHLIRILSTSATGGVVYVGHTTVSYGFIPAPIAETHETILFEYGDSFYSLSGLYSTGVWTAYSALPKGIKAFIVTISGSDSGSNAANCAAVFQTTVSPYSNQVKLDLARITNSAVRAATGIVTGYEIAAPEQYNNQNYSFRVNMTASGSSTLNISAMIIGIII